MAGEKVERKYLAHFIDAGFNADPTAAGATFNYIRLGKDLEAFADELNPQIDIRKNILGEQNVTHSGYEAQSSVDTFYAYDGDPLFEQLALIANERRTGDACRTTRVDALFHVSTETSTLGQLVCDWAFREDCWIVPTSVGGDTSGVQIPFQIYDSGNRVAGTMAQNSTTHKWEFTASS